MQYKKEMNHKKTILLDAGSLADIFKLYSAILPQYRIKQTYISGLLSRNEVDSNNQYNRKLFVRVRRGYYRLNDDMLEYRE